MNKKINCPIFEKQIDKDECNNIQKINEKCITCKNYIINEKNNFDDTIELSKLFDTINEMKEERHKSNE